MTSMKEIEEDLNKKVSFLSGLIVAFRDQIHTDIQLKPGNDGPSIPAHRALLVCNSLSIVHVYIYILVRVVLRNGIM